MKNIIGAALFASLFSSALDSHGADCLATVRGVSVAIPAPDKLVTEVGSERRASFEYMVPSRNRLLCAFVPTDYISHLKNPATGMDRYMVVEVSRRLDEKDVDITTATFEQIVASTKQQMGDASQLDSTVRVSAEEVINKLRALQNSTNISIEKPIPLGPIFQTADAYGFLMTLPISSGGATEKVVGASILLRVRNRLIFAYVYGADAESSLKWIPATAEEWSRQILAVNSRK